MLNGDRTIYRSAANTFALESTLLAEKLFKKKKRGLTAKAKRWGVELNEMNSSLSDGVGLLCANDPRQALRKECLMKKTDQSVERHRTDEQKIQNKIVPADSPKQ